MLQDLSLLAEFSCRLSFSFSAGSESLPAGSGLQESLSDPEGMAGSEPCISPRRWFPWGWLPSSTQEFLHTENPQLASGNTRAASTSEPLSSLNDQPSRPELQLSMERQTTGNTEITCFNSIKITTLHF